MAPKNPPRAWREHVRKTANRFHQGEFVSQKTARMMQGRRTTLRIPTTMEGLGGRTQAAPLCCLSKPKTHSCNPSIAERLMAHGSDHAVGIRSARAGTAKHSLDEDQKAFFQGWFVRYCQQVGLVPVDILFWILYPVAKRSIEYFHIRHAFKVHGPPSEAFLGTLPFHLLGVYCVPTTYFPITVGLYNPTPFRIHKAQKPLFTYRLYDHLSFVQAV